MQSRHLLLIGAALLALVLGALVYLGYQPERLVGKPLEALPEGVELALSSMDYAHLVDGVQRWRLQADRIERQGDQAGFDIRRPRMTLFDKQGNYVGRMQAEAGWVSTDYRQVRLLETVEAEHVAGYSLQTSRLDFDQVEQAVVTEAPVRLLGQGVTLQGTGLTLDLVTNRFRILADVHAEFVAEGGK